MKYQSQNNETAIVIDYFNGKKEGILLEIGANDGKTFSNSYDLIELGWYATLVEPSSVFNYLEELHKDNGKVTLHNEAIGIRNGTIKFYESDAHVKGGSDKALVSTVLPEEMERWKGVNFTEKEVPIVTWDTFIERNYSKTNFEYVSIDVEGLEWDILSQINLTSIGCKCLCIEYNGNKTVARIFKNYCYKFGLTEIHRNAENLIFAL